MYCISHVALSVSNLDNSVEFYKKFGFKISREWSAADDSLRIVHLLLNGLLLELFCYKNFNKSPEYIKNLSTDLPVVGTKHFALGVKSIDEAYSDLLDKCIITSDKKITLGRLGKKYFFIADPDGILVEIIEI